MNYSAKGLTVQALMDRFPARTRPTLQTKLQQALSAFNRTIIVLDDDPTGTQTVYGVPVITCWETAILVQELLQKPRMLFILTNSRALSAEATEQLHREIAKNVIAASRQSGRDFLLVSRGDSTLRGHFPLETETLRQTIEEETALTFDGEIICPFFLEGGRFTVENVHYLVEDGTLLPVGESEFAKDKTFGYKNSNLCAWIEEKTAGTVAAEKVSTITLDALRSGSDEVGKTLMAAHDFSKIVVNAISYEDLMQFVPELFSAIQAGKQFILRSASSILQVMAGCVGGRVLSQEELQDRENHNGGIVIIGSHVKKTTRQLDRLLAGFDVDPIEFNQHLVLDRATFEAEILRVSRAVDTAIRSGRSVAVYTRRERLDLNTADKEEELRLATRISDGVVQIISGLQMRPNFIIAKGGITSSDVATKGLGILRAQVMGQILPGIPVWKAGDESKFPGMPYVIFPGNVGADTALLEAVQKLHSIY